MTFKTGAMDFIQPGAPVSACLAAARRSVRTAVRRYLKWRAVSQLRRLDAHALHDLGLRPVEFLSALRDLEIDEMRRRNGFP